MSTVVQAAIWRPDGSIDALVKSTTRQLNAMLRAPGWTWREIAAEVKRSLDVPALDTLPKHPDLVEPAG